MQMMSPAIDAAFAEFGRPATFNPQGGATPITCTILVRRPDDIAQFGDARTIAKTRRVQVRLCEVATVARDDTFTVGGETWKVSAAPRREDPLQLVWTCDVAG